MDIPQKLFYSKEHEWVRIQDDSGVIGVTDYAQRELGDIVFVEFPQVGDHLKASSAFGSLESVKSVSEIYCPFSGTVVAINRILIDSPELINQDPYRHGWMTRMLLDNPAELDDLLTAEQYTGYLKELGE